MKSAAELTAARARAHRMRGDFLMDVREQVFLPQDVIDEATREGSEPLRTIRLSTLLTAQPGVGEVAAGRIIDRLLRILGHANMKRSEVTVGWLIDWRSGGRRLTAYANAAQQTSPPWAGFPLTPSPTQ